MAKRGGYVVGAWMVRLVLAAIWLALLAQCALALTTTSLSDVVYLANGQRASGVVLISWPSFTTAAGEAVPAGNTTVTIGQDGVLSVALAPNEGATPAGAYYTVVLHLDGAPVTTEYWVVPAAGPANLSAIRSKVIPLTRAVPLNGGAVSVAGLVQKTGDVMQGPLTLSGDPVAPAQASTKRYVDLALGVQQGLINAASSDASDAKAQAAQARALASTALPAAGTLNLVKDCGLPVDGVTDSAPAWDACMSAHPGATFDAPKIQPNGVADFVFSRDITLNGTLYGHGFYYNDNTNQPGAGTTLKFAAGSAGVHRLSGSVMHDINIVGSDPAPRDTTPASAALLNAPDGNYLTEYKDTTLSLVRSGGVVTATLQYGTWFTKNGILRVSGALPTDFNGQFYIASVNGNVMTWNQPGPDESAAKAATLTPATTGPLQATASGAGAGSGMVIEGAKTITYNVSISNFARNCFEVTGGPKDLFISDDTVFRDSWVIGCRMHGLAVLGASDTSKGSYDHIDTYFNQFYGVFATSFLGDTLRDTQASYNSLVYSPAMPAARPLSSTMTAGNVLTLTGASPLGIVPGNAIVVEGSTNAGHNVSRNPVAMSACTSVTAPARQTTCTLTGSNHFAVGDPVEQLGSSNTIYNGEVFFVTAVADNSVTMSSTYSPGGGTGGTLNDAKVSCFADTVSPDGKTVTCRLPYTVANGTGTGGTVRLASGGEFMSAVGVDSGAYTIARHAVAGHQLSIAPYTEGGHGSHNPDGCGHRYNASVLTIQGHSGDCYAPNWLSNDITADEAGLHFTNPRGSVFNTTGLGIFAVGDVRQNTPYFFFDSSAHPGDARFAGNLFVTGAPSQRVANSTTLSYSSGNGNFGAVGDGSYIPSLLLFGTSQDGAFAPYALLSASGAAFNEPVSAPAVIAAPSTPASSSATCTAGAIWADANYIYVCTATNTIKRAALTAF